MSLSNEQGASDVYTLLASLVERYVAGDIEQPVNPYRSPEELKSLLDFSLTESGESVEGVMDAMESLAGASPRSTSKRFLNQLFGGRDAVATAADMLVPVLNSSMYTFKAAGAMAIVEETVLNRLIQKIGFDTDTAQGTFTPGGSMSNMIAMIIARNRSFEDIRDEGIGGRSLICYTSADSHYSVAKNAGILGIGRNNARKVAVNDRGEMDCNELNRMIVADLMEGHIPCMVVATSGSTVMGSFDPIRELTEIARSYNAWLHVDASFGGSALMSPKYRDLLDGIDRADSVAWNPHKVMGVPLSAAAFITRESGILRKNLDETADYLFQGDDDVYNPGTRSMQCGRRNDALKVWAAWKHHGDEGYRTRIDHLMNLAQRCAQLVSEDDRFVLSCEPAYVNVCFEVRGKCSRAVCDALRERNELLVGHATVHGRRIIRVPFVNGDLTVADVQEMLDLILGAAESLPDGDNAVARREPACGSSGCKG